MVLVVKPFNRRTARQPNTPPTKEIKSASMRKEKTTEGPPKPSARMVAISRPRSATAEYMVLSAPKTPANGNDKGDEPAKRVKERGKARGLLGELIVFANAANLKGGIGRNET